MCPKQDIQTTCQDLIQEIQYFKVSLRDLRRCRELIEQYGRPGQPTECPERKGLLRHTTKIVTALLVSILIQQIAVHDGFLRRVLHFLASTDDTSQCLIDIPVDSKTYFRPPVDCSMCRGIQQVDVLNYITPEDFEQIYAYSGRPLIVRGALANWTAMNVFSYEFFQELYHNHSQVFYSESCQFFPYQTEFSNLQEALSMNEERKRKPWYFGWSNCDSEAADILRRHYSRPYFLPRNSESSRTDWIFIGTSGLGAHMHVDHVGLPSWQAQIQGEKLWSLEPPPECYYHCESMQIVVQPGDTRFQEEFG